MSCGPLISHTVFTRGMLSPRKRQPKTMLMRKFGSSDHPTVTSDGMMGAQKGM
jgi:hypothetical protein